jgi:hypothetical protein
MSAIFAPAFFASSSDCLGVFMLIQLSFDDVFFMDLSCAVGVNNARCVEPCQGRISPSDPWHGRTASNQE